MENAIWNHSPAPRQPGVHVFKAEPLEALVPLIDWKFFLMGWGVQKNKERSEEVLKEGRAFLDKIIADRLLEARAVIGFFQGERQGESLGVLGTS